MRRAYRLRPFTAAMPFLWLFAAPALAQSPLEDVARAARVAGEGVRIGSPLGAGDDPQTSVAQPEASAKPSANLNTSIQGSLGPYGDPVTACARS